MPVRLNFAAVTFELDWAPDWCVRECYELCRQAGVKATFFATNPLPVLAEIQADPLFELGLHPNFLPGSSQHTNAARPQTHASVLKFFSDFLPRAQSLRTHSLYSCSLMYGEIEARCPALVNDVSFFTYFQPHFAPLYIWHSVRNRPLVRLPYQFEDDSACLTRNFDYDDFLRGCATAGGNSGRTVIFDFHPIHIALNSRTMANYEELKKEVAPGAATPADVARHRDEGRAGTRVFFERLLTMIAESRTIRELGDDFRRLNRPPFQDVPCV